MSTASRPEREPRRWTEEEDAILRSEAQLQQDSTGNVSDWNLIATKLPTRSNKDCRKRWTKIFRAVNKGSWSSSEDARLTTAVAKHGLCWTQVAWDVGTRHADQCAKRWQHALDPSLNHSKWTPAEDNQLLQSVKEHGREWRQISRKAFADRSPTNLKNRYAILTGYGNGRGGAVSKPGRSGHAKSVSGGSDSAWRSDVKTESLVPRNHGEDTRRDSLLSSDVEMYHDGTHRDQTLPTFADEHWNLGLVESNSSSSNMTPDQQFLQPLVEDQAMIFETDMQLDPALLFDAVDWEGMSLPTDSVPTPSAFAGFEPDPYRADTSTDDLWSQGFDPQSSSRVMLEMQDVSEDTLREVTNILYRDRVRVKMDISHGDGAPV